MDDPQPASESEATAGTAAGGPTSGRTLKGSTNRVELGKRELAGARRVAESKAVVPHLYLTRTVPLPAGPEGIGAAELIAAIGRALREHPRLNSAYRDGAITEHARINVGLAVETTEGTVVPTIFDADQRSAEEIAEQVESLSSRAAGGELTSPELSGRTFTLSVIGAGADSMLPAVPAGQAAHLATGRVREAAVAAGGEIIAGHVIGLGLSCDHRAVRPPQAAAFLERLGELIGNRS